MSIILEFRIFKELNTKTMKEIQATALLKIHDGKLDQFKKLAEKCVQTVREKDKGTLQYDWFMNKDQTHCEVREKYQNSKAVLEHMGNLGETLGELLSICDMSLEIYGSPSDALRGALEGLDIKYYHTFLSLSDSAN